MGCRTALRRVMHFNGTDLDFEHKSVAVSNTCVKALVPVGFRFGDVILEPKWFRIEEPMDGIECKVAFVLARHDDAEGEQVVNFLERQVFLLHFSPHPGGVFRAALNRYK